eukprot:TRINITY_DN7652_c0_g3_i1.p1 TRINITY_DN7652_c0_g3~~TRINITY_DN7652_c0_g3_i1.p1  ORF type:complete len:1591 (-),score=303.38 TRINITY_DN7652_c0_g3_i1:114-4736(-)
MLHVATDIEQESLQAKMPETITSVPISPGNAEMPLTPSSGIAGVAEQVEVQDYSSEPLSERFRSKDLGRRCSAYAEAQATMESYTDASDGEREIFDLLGQHLETCLGETLPKGQDAALTVLATYLKKCPGIEERSSEMLPLVRKLTEHKAIDKPKMQQLAPEVVLLIAEICECPPVAKELIECLAELEQAKKKSQGFFKKQVGFIIELVSKLLSDFGIQKMPLKLGYVNVVVKYIADSDRGIREACYSVLVELFGWMGEKNMSEIIETLPGPQKTEINKRIEASKAEGAAQKEAKRRYRGDAAVVSVAKAQTSATISSTACDSFDLVEAVDALQKLPKGWCISKITSLEKWKEKLEYLQVLSNLLDEKRLLPCDGYAALVPTLKFMLKSESNIPVLTEAAKCIGLMSKGLRKDFEKHAKMLLPVALSRITDKSVWKPHCLIERVEQLLWSIPFEVLLEELRPHYAAANKSIFVKKEGLSLLFRALESPQVQKTYPDALQRFLAPVAAAALPLMDDADNTLRQEAGKVLAALVFKNRESSEVGPLVLEKLPAHRRAVFDDEWRKVAKDLPSPLSSACRSPVAPGASSDVEQRPSPAKPNAGGRRISPLKQRNASPGPMRPQRQTGDSVACSPTTAATVGGRRPSPLKGQQKTDSPKGAVAAQLARPMPASQADDGDGCCSPPSEVQGTETKVDCNDALQASDQQNSLMAQMAEEIKHLRSKVEQMELERNQAPAPAPGPPAQIVPAVVHAPPSASHSSTSAGSSLRAPSGDRSVRAAEIGPSKSMQTVSASARPSTPRRVRAPSAERRDATPTRCESASRRRNPTPPRRDASPLQIHRAATPTKSRPQGSMSARPVAGEVRPTRSQSLLALQAEEGVAPFSIDTPKLSKQARQLKERSQYWGPEQIPPEHLAALKEAWRPCLDDGLWRTMFSIRMEEQLVALQSWRQQAAEYCNLIFEAEVLDLLLKWLVWMLFNTNTQVWKLLLEVFEILLQNLADAQIQLTDRETQILVPNLVERSGHSIPLIRETMVSLLRSCSLVCPRTRLWPMLLHGLTSKSKRSAACSMRAICYVLDRPTVMGLLRSQKDLALILKTTEDKDADLKHATIQTVAEMSLHVDEDGFNQICRSLSGATKNAIKAAASKLTPACEQQEGKAALATSLGMNVESESKVLQRRFNFVGDTQRDAGRAALPVRSLAVPSTPERLQRSPRLSRNAPQRQASPQPSPQASPQITRHFIGRKSLESATSATRLLECSPLSTSTPHKERPTRELTVQLSGFIDASGSNVDFESLCTTLVERIKSGDMDAPLLAEAICCILPACFSPTSSCMVRCGPLLAVLEELCAKKDGVRSLPPQTLRRFLLELLRHLENGSWAKSLSDGPQLLRKLNLSCVMLINAVNRLTAYNLLLDLAFDETEAVSGSLLTKCLRKLNKNLSSSRNLDQEALDILELVHRWLDKAGKRDDRGGSTFASTAEGAKEVVEAVLQACPEAAAKWSRRLQEAETDSSVLQAWLGTSKGDIKAGGSCEADATAKVSSPCRVRRSS